MGKRSAEFKTWLAMKARCTNQKHPFYKDYGGRGIKICPRWMTFSNFLDDMGRKPTPDHTIDRINNDGDYEPTNCKWSTPIEQSNNRNTNTVVSYHGERLTIAQLIRKSFPKALQASARTRFYWRRAKGWSVEEAIDTSPVGRGHAEERHVSAG